MASKIGVKRAVPSDMTRVGRRLRRTQTPAEDLFWRHVRDRRLANAKFRRQVVIGRYVADFVCSAANLIVELDGGVHLDTPDYDAKRTADLEQLGYHVIRFSNEEVLKHPELVYPALVRIVSKRHESPLIPSRANSPTVGVSNRVSGQA